MSNLSYLKINEEQNIHIHSQYLSPKLLIDSNGVTL